MNDEAGLAARFPFLATGSCAASTAPAAPAPVLPFQLAREERFAREHRRAGVARRRVREIARVVRDPEHLAAGGAERAQAQRDVLHAGAPSVPAIGGISRAVGRAWRSACSDTFAANTHIATTSRTKNAQT